MSKHLVLVVDQSGSMFGIQNDMNGSIRSWFDAMKELNPDALLTSVIFNTECRITNNRRALKNVREESLLISSGGGTALNDATMSALNTIGDDETALVVVVTDGQENSSREFTLAQVKKRIADLTERGVEFQYISAAPSAFTDSEGYGYAPGATSTFTMDSVGTQVVANAITRSGTSYLQDTP